MNYVYYYDRVNNPSIYAQFPGLDEEGIARRMCDIMDLDFDMFLSPEEIHRIIDLTPEGNRFVRVIERENGQRSFLRLYDDNQKHPSETEISAALKRFVVKSPKVAFLTGHGMRDIHKTGDRDYNRFAESIYSDTRSSTRLRRADRRPLPGRYPCGRRHRGHCRHAHPL